MSSLKNSISSFTVFKLSSFPVTELSITITESPRFTRAFVMWLPIKPAPPVTKYFIILHLFQLHNIWHLILC